MKESVEEQVLFVAPDKLSGPGLEEEVKRLEESMNGLIWIIHCQFSSGFDPFSLVRRIQQPGSSSSLVLILDCLLEFYVELAESSGAGVVLAREDTVETLRHGFQAARLGASFRSGAYESARNQFTRQRSGIGGRGLSQRELGTAIAIADGRSISEISYDWGLSRKTVSTFRRRALSKLELKSDAELIRFFVEKHSYLFDGGNEDDVGENDLFLPG